MTMNTVGGRMRTESTPYADNLTQTKLVSNQQVCLSLIHGTCGGLGSRAPKMALRSHLGKSTMVMSPPS